ncbi:ATP-binding protein [Streptomyces lasalocidi]
MTLIGAEHPDLVAPGSLCVSELVTNAVRHTRSPRIAIEVSIGHGRVVVYVYDNRPCPLPVPTASYPELEHGRGLALVEAHADLWGTVLLGGRSLRSKAVWFSFRTDTQGTSRQSQ